MTSDFVKAARWTSVALPGIAFADGEAKFGFQTPQTPVAHQLYDLHAITLGICIVIGYLLIGISMAYDKQRPPLDWKSSQWLPVYDWIEDNGYDKFSSWIS